jgi:hypothetical protein
VKAQSAGIAGDLEGQAISAQRVPRQPANRKIIGRAVCGGAVRRRAWLTADRSLQGCSTLLTLCEVGAGE